MKKRKDYEKFKNNIPALFVSGRNIAEAWENSVVELYNKGSWYRRKGPKDTGRLQVDSTMMITIENPDGPFFHKYAQHDFSNLLEYEMEMLGAVDSCVHDPKLDSDNDPAWPYHYKKRMTHYPSSEGFVDQLENIIKGLSENPFKRNNLGTIWIPELDFDSEDPPCLQQFWTFITPVEDSPEELYNLNVNYTFRSRNVMRASSMNIRGLNRWQSFIKEGIIERTGMPLVNGRIVDFSFSYHVSANDLPILNGFMRRLDKAKKGETDADETSIDKRYYPNDVVYTMYDEDWSSVEERIIKKVEDRFEQRLNRRLEQLKDKTYSERLIQFEKEKFKNRVKKEKEKIKAVSEKLRSLK